MRRTTESALGIPCTQLSRRGATTTEYAVFIGFLALTAIALPGLIGRMTESSFSTTSLALNDNTGATHRSQSLVKDASSDPRQESNDIAEIETATATPWDLIALVLLVPISLFYSGSRLLKKEEPVVEQKEELPPDAVSLPVRKLFEKRQRILKVISNDWSSLVSTRLKVADLMSRKLAIVHPDSSADEVRELMTEFGIHHLLVCTNDQMLVGIISDRDIHNDTATVAAEFMTPNPMTVTENTLVNPAITIMIRNRFNCLPVVQAGRVCGVLTRSDLLLSLQCALITLDRVSEGLQKEGDGSDSHCEFAVPDFSYENKNVASAAGAAMNADIVGASRQKPVVAGQPY